MDILFSYIIKPLLSGIGLFAVAGILAVILIRIGDIIWARDFVTRIPPVSPKVKNILTWAAVFVSLWFLGILLLYK